ncbi:MAG: 5-carboxymethyl-2-hydroxymuconate isomerase [Paracoccaceae bacterium]|jgi:5-carboxymethyl-2-hydroxymuconate isomerase|nr:5-carboxymethyl-2-hydroxymuconate isomerase [Paracoccaceae bacterium]MDG1972675.1 5-carboxymethyl-2-hydroxymuconate isomerase [Paracoccaceae bacterium]
MPHLSFEYSAPLEDRADLPGFASAIRDAMVETGVFPLAGTRVRGHRADISVTADGGAHDFLHMTLKMGIGRDDATKAAAAEAIYTAAEDWLKPRLPGASVAVSLEVLELPPPSLSIKRFNTVRDHL